MSSMMRWLAQWMSTEQQMLFILVHEGQVTEVSDIPEEAERSGAVHSGEEKAQRYFTNVFKYQTESRGEDRTRLLCLVTGQEEMGTN